MIGIPSSVNPAAPAFASSFISTSSLPASPCVMAAVCNTWIPVSLPLSWIYFSVSILSTTGLVLAIHTTMVKPPLAAAAAPVYMSSLYVNPGSLKCTWVSTSPGATTSPVASIISRLFFSASLSVSVIWAPVFIIIPLSIRTSIILSVLLTASTTRPFLISSIYTSINLII